MARSSADRGGVGRGSGAVRGGGAGRARARIREAPLRTAPVESIAPGREVPGRAQPAVQRQPWYQVVSEPPEAWPEQAQYRPLGQAGSGGQAALADPPAGVNPEAASPPGQVPRDVWGALQPFAMPHAADHPPTADGRRNCGPLERILWRQWDEGTIPPPEVVAAIERLADFPRQLQDKLVGGLDGIYVGAGGVPDLDDMSALRGVALPSGQATWDACAGAYGNRKIVIGSRPSPTPDVMCHEVGHALDDLDGPPGKWQSESAEFRLIYDQCQPRLAFDFHRQRGGLGRKEFFADAFAAIASCQRPALVDMLGGETRLALRVMLYFNRRYGI